MKIVFIAGPYTGDGAFEFIERNIREAEKYQIALANKEIEFFCLHNHTEYFSSKKGVTPPEQFYDFDFEFLMRVADAILIIPHWEMSRRAKKEIAWARACGMKIFYPKNPDDIEDIVAWARE